MSTSQLRASRTAGPTERPDLDLLNIPHLLRDVEVITGRQMILRPLPDYMDSVTAGCGLRLSAPGITRILHPHGAGRRDTQRHILHSLAHALLDHGRPLTYGEMQRLIPQLGPSMVGRIQQGAGTTLVGSYTAEDETVADALADAFPTLDTTASNNRGGLTSLLRSRPGIKYPRLLGRCG
ncbi:hypothetical protein [Streptomyces sp. NBC_01304]|uniref:hypothetical protein n=1 Tax=Streptomyces sp. NBC_01304 TaxID=2903818 RepID=UPI002E0E1337|nr:hypothetical protein OG430_48115 [Streptomyces sp. NBC_01304]